ncbi:hypothetical protein B0H11DRAFT_2383265 [Mycena galericulata]|nr:hypothetical protein B0H11DRAFT_2383265 [Mycena galericulata]
MVNNLLPTTSFKRGRYHKPYSGLPEYQSETIIPAGSHDPPAPALPLDWTRHVHPEGLPYFCRPWDSYASSLQVVTEDWVSDTNIRKKLIPAIAEVEDILRKQNTPITSELELFLQFKQDGRVSYYLVDHVPGRIFWFHDVDLEELGLLRSLSPGHFDIQLKELYWAHIEHFPMHFGPNGLPRSKERFDELNNILAHAQLDDMTSPVSTVDYPAKTCKTILENFLRSKGALQNIAQGHVICNYAPKKYQLKLDTVFTDHIVNAYHWKSMIGGCIKGWRDGLQWAAVALFLHIFLVFLDANKMLAAISAALFGCSFITVEILINYYAPMEDSPSSEVRDYLERICSPTLKFQFVSLTFALPQCLQIWGLLVLLLNLTDLSARQFGYVPIILTSAVSGLIAVGILWTISTGFHLFLKALSTGFEAFSIAMSISGSSESK